MYRNRKRGFTMVEMLVALFILSATTLFVTVVVATMGGTRDANYESNAFRIASSKIDELRSLGYSSLPADGAFSDPQLSSLPNAAANTTVTVWDAKTKKVVASVSWRGPDDRARLVSITTLITEVGGL